MDGQMDRQADESDFIGYCLTNAEHPKEEQKSFNITQD